MENRLTMNGNAGALTHQQPEPGLLVWTGAPSAKVVQALARAQAEVGDVAHDKENQFHGYRYTSAEAIIRAGREAATKGRLVLAVLGTRWEPLELPLLQVEIDILLGCADSGESTQFRVIYPGQVEKGRPADKAAAAAVTLGLSYALRNLLLIPRVADHEDVSARDDTGERGASGGRQNDRRQRDDRGSGSGGGRPQPQPQRQQEPPGNVKAAQRLAAALECRDRTLDDLREAMRQRLDETYSAGEVQMIGKPVEQWSKRVGTLAGEILRSAGWEPVRDCREDGSAPTAGNPHDWVAQALASKDVSPAVWTYWGQRLVTNIAEAGAGCEWPEPREVAARVVGQASERGMLTPPAANASQTVKREATEAWRRLADTVLQRFDLPSGKPLPEPDLVGG